MTTHRNRLGDDIVESYDRWSETYDSDRNATRDLDARVLRAAALPIDGADVLELGAGTGKNTEYLADRAASVIALDFSEGMLARARARVSSPKVQFIRADLRERLPVADGSVDQVVGNLVLEHIADCAHVFAETARVLRSNGGAYFAELHPFRQARGGQAQFTDASSGNRVFVKAHAHTIEEFLDGARAAGLLVDCVADHIEDDAADDVPRLLVLRFMKT